MAQSADDPLARRLAEGRPEAVAEIYDRFGPMLFRVACSYVAAPADAEDAVQEVFVGLVRGGSKLGEVANLRAYLFTALKRAALRLAERRRHEQAAPACAFLDIAAPSPKALDSERSEQLERALHELPIEQRELVALKIDGGLTLAEVAEVLGVSPNTAASRYRYALEKLRARLEA